MVVLVEVDAADAVNSAPLLMAYNSSGPGVRP